MNELMETILLGNGTRLDRTVASDGAVVAAAVAESIDQLQPWMPWATAESATTTAQTARAVQMYQGWSDGTDYVWVLRNSNSLVFLGIFGLHRRIGPGAIELGYWLHSAATGRGYAVTAVAALLNWVRQLPDIERVEIHVDEANHASSAVPQRLGLRLARIDERAPQAPGESGRLQIWVTQNNEA